MKNKLMNLVGFSKAYRGKRYFSTKNIFHAKVIAFLFGGRIHRSGIRPKFFHEYFDVIVYLGIKNSPNKESEGILWL